MTVGTVGTVGTLPPRSLDELHARASALAGRSLVELEALLEADRSAPMLRRKGKTGQLIERALGASAGSSSTPDFVGLGVELKTIPVAEHAEWASSSVRSKLAHVLFVPVVYPSSTRDDRCATLGTPLFWRPSTEQESVLRADFDDLVGLIALGGIERLTAKLGLWLQVRPKAAHGRVRTRAYGPEGEYLETIPRGFYLRARFTGALLRDPRALPGASP
jgi:DNA mismatch repair protein MutH